VIRTQINTYEIKTLKPTAKTTETLTTQLKNKKVIKKHENNNTPYSDKKIKAK